MPWNKTDRSFKTLINKRVTDSDAKFYFNEKGDFTINTHQLELWVDAIPSTAPGATTDIVEYHNTLTLVEDTSVPTKQAWFATSNASTVPAQTDETSRLKNWVSDKYGSTYEIVLYDTSNVQIPPSDGCGWFFDYQTGILTFTSTTTTTGGGGSLSSRAPFKIKGYRYIGRTGLDGNIIKNEVRVATTPATSFSGWSYSSELIDTGVTSASLTIDGISLNTTEGLTGDRILIKNWSTLSNNGIYYVERAGDGASDTWRFRRAPDFNDTQDIFPGTMVFVRSGTVNARTVWSMSNASFTTLDAGGATGEITFAQFITATTRWSALTAPDANLSLSMSTHTTTFNWTTGTSTNNLFSLTTDASANGTGALLNIATGSSSTVLPLLVKAGATTALTINASAQVLIGTLTNGRITYAGASGLLQDSANMTFDGNRIALATTGNTGGLLIGGDANLYRSAADTLKTDDSLIVGVNLGVLNAGTFSLYESGSVNFSSFAAGTQANDLRYTLPTTQPSTNQVLTATSVTGSGPYDITLGWVSNSTDMAIGGTVTSGTTGSILFVGSGPVLAQDNNNLFWDDTNNYLGVGTSAAPGARLHVSGSQSASAWGVSGILFRVSGATLTDTTSSGTVTNVGASAIATPTIAASNTTTFTHAANLYITGGPVAGTNVTLTNSYALWVNTGNTRFDDNVTIGIAPTSSRFAIGGSLSAAAWGSNGISLRVVAATYTDTSSSGTVGTVTSSTFNTPTFAASNSTTFTNAANVYISNAPTAGTNVTFTNSYALWVNNGNVRIDDTLTLGGTTLAARLAVTGSISASAWGVQGIYTRVVGGTATDTSSSGTVNSVVMSSFGQNTVAASSVTTFTHASTVYIANAPTAGSNVTLTNAYALYVAAGATRFDGVVGTNRVPAYRLDVDGNLSVAAWGTNGPAFTSRAGTFTDTTSSGTVATAAGNSFLTPIFAASSVTTYTDAASVYIANSPTAGSNVTLTNAYALWVDSGTVRLDSSVQVRSLTSGRVTYAGTNGLLQDSANMTFDGSKLSLATTGSSGGLLIGGDANLYRSAADVLKTDDSFVVGVNLSVLNAGTFSLYESGSVNFSSFTAGTQANDLRYTLPTTQPSTNQVLSASAVTGTGPYDITLTWVTPATSGITIGDGITGSTVGSVLFVGAGSTLAQDNANFFWDDTNNTLGIGTTRTGAISGTNPSVRILGTGSSSATSSFEVQDSGTNTILFVRNDSRVGIGTNAPSYDLSLGGESARTVGVNRRGTGAGNNLTLQSGGAQSGGSNLAAGTLILSSGTATGNAAGYVDIYAVNNANLVGGTTDNPAGIHARFGSGRIGLGTSTLTYDITLASLVAASPYTYAIGMLDSTIGSGHSLNIQAGHVTTTADLNGGSIVLTAGNSTGSGSSSIAFYTATAGGSGTTVRTSSLKMTLTGAGQLQVSTTGSSAGILLGGDAQLYRSAADVLRTPDSLTVDASLTVGTLTSTRVTYAGTGGLLQDSANMTFDGNRLALATTGNTGGLLIGGDANLYRSAADTLKTDDSLIVAVNLTVNSLTSGRVTYASTSGLLVDSPNFTFTTIGGQLGLAATGSGGGVLIGGDTQLYRSAADVLRTPDSFTVDVNLTVSGTASIGAASGTTGTINLLGSTSGTVSVLVQAAAGTYNFNLPTTAGSSGHVLTSGGGGATAMTWTDPASLAVRWNSITSPNGAQSLTMSTHTTTWNWATGTSTNNLFNLTTDASANGTGALLRIATGTSATVVPMLVVAAGTTALTVNASAQVLVNSLTSGRVTYAGTNGLLQDSANMTFDGNRISLATTGNTGGLLIGGDANLYRSAADVLRTDDSFIVGVNLSVLNAGTFSLYESGSVNFSSFAAGTQANDLRYTLPTSQPSTNQVLTATAVTGSGPYDITLGWVTNAASITIGDTVNSGTTGSILFVGSGPVLAQDNANFYWDDTNNTFGVGTTRSGAISGTNPTTRIKGSGTTSATSSFEIQDSSSNTLLFVRDDGKFLVGENTPVSATSVAEFHLDQNNDTCLSVHNATSGAASSASLRLVGSGSGYGHIKATSDVFNSPSQWAESLVIEAHTLQSGGLWLSAYTNTITLATTATNALDIQLDDLGKVGFGLAPSAHLHAGRNLELNAWGVAGIGFRFDAATYTDASSSGTVASVAAHGFAQPTFAATNVTTYTDAASLYISNAPATGANVTITNAYALWVDAGIVRLDGSVQVRSLTNGRVTYAGTNGLLQDSANMTFDGNRIALATTGNTGGLLIGGDANLYRSAADVLKTDDSLWIGARLTVGEDPATYPGSALRISKYPNNDTYAHIGGNFLVWNTTAYTRTQYAAGVLCDHYYGATSNTSAGLYGGMFNMVIQATKNTGTVSNIAGGRFTTTWSAISTATGDDISAAQFILSSSSATANISTAYGIKNSTAITSGHTITNLHGIYTIGPTAATGTITNYNGVYIASPTSATITNHYGIYVEDLAVGTNRYAIYFAGTSGTARQGITWNGDTNIYRSAADVLATDDHFSLTTSNRELRFTTSSFLGGILFNSEARITAHSTTGFVITPPSFAFTSGEAQGAVLTTVLLPSSASTALIYGTNVATYYDDSNTTGNFSGAIISGKFLASATTFQIGSHTFSEVIAVQGRASAYDDNGGTGGTVLDLYGGQFIVTEDGSGARITNAYGVYIDNSGAYTANGQIRYGLYVNSMPDPGVYSGTTTVAIALSGTGGARDGILFGSDTNIYRSGANTLKTDDSFVVGTNLSVLNAGTFSLYESGSVNFSSFVAGTQANDLRYTLPTSQPSTNQVLTATAISGSGPYDITLGWATPSATIAIGGAITSGTVGSVLFVGAGTVLAQDNSNFFWDDTNNYLGLGTTAAPAARLHVAGNQTASAWTTNGVLLRVGAATLTDSSSSGTVAASVANAIQTPTFAASSSTTYTDAATLYISANPTAGTNVAITNGYALWVDSGATRLDGNLIVGTLTSTRVTFAGASGLLTDSSNFTYTTGTGQLALATTGSGAGILIGGDTQLYRTSADVLRTPDSLQVDSYIGVNATPSTLYRVQAVLTTSTNVSGRTIYGTNDITGNITSAFPAGAYFQSTPNAGASGISYAAGIIGSIRSSSSQSGTVAEQYGIDFDNWHSGSANVTVMAGARSFVTLRNTSGGTVASMSAFTATLDAQSGGTNSAVTAAYGFDFGASLAGTSTITTLTGLRIQNPSGSQTITTFYGLRINDLTRGGTNYGIYFDGTSGLSRQGVWWNGDTNLYRSAADTLKTDDAFVSGSTITGASSLTLGAAAGTTGSVLLKGTTSGTVTVTVASAAGTWTMTLPTSGGTNGYVLTTNGSGTTSWSAPGIPWTDVTGTSTTAAAHNGYLANNAALVTITLPTPAVGSVIEIVGVGAGGWRAQCASSHTIRMGTTVSASTGYAQSTNQYDCIKIVGISATAWLIVSAVGTIDIT